MYGKFKNKFSYEKRKKIEDNISYLKKIKENSFSSKIIGEMIRNLNLISYNNKDMIQETWSGKKYEHDSDEEFMKMLLDDPETQRIIAENKLKNESKHDSDSESSSSSERPELLPKRVKNKKNIIV